MDTIECEGTRDDNDYAQNPSQCCDCRVCVNRFMGTLGKLNVLTGKWVTAQEIADDIAETKEYVNSFLWGVLFQKDLVHFQPQTKGLPYKWAVNHNHAAGIPPEKRPYCGRCHFDECILNKL